jgi:hypothetical protein
MEIRPLRSITRAASHAQVAQEPGGEAQPTSLAVAVADRGRRSRSAIGVPIEGPVVDAGEALLCGISGDGIDVRKAEDLTLSVVTADHGRQLDIGVRNAVEAMQVLGSSNRRLSHIARPPHHGAVPRRSAAVVHYHEVDGVPGYSELLDSLDDPGTERVQAVRRIAAEGRDREAETQIREAALGRHDALHQVIDDILALAAFDVEVDAQQVGGVVTIDGGCEARIRSAGCSWFRFRATFCAYRNDTNRDFRRCLELGLSHVYP